MNNERFIAVVLLSITVPACGLYDPPTIVTEGADIDPSDVLERVYSFLHEYEEQFDLDRNRIAMALPHLKIIVLPGDDLTPHKPTRINGLYSKYRWKIRITEHSFTYFKTLEHELIHWVLELHFLDSDGDHTQPDWEWLYGCTYQSHQNKEKDCDARVIP